MSQENQIQEVGPSFQETFDQFLKFSEQVLKYNLSGDLILLSSGNKSNAIKTGLEGYKRIYRETRTSSKHVDKFKEVYQKCLPQLKRSSDVDKFMDWFQNQSFIIQPKEKSRNKIHIVAVFRNCCRIAEHISDEAEKHPQNSEQYYNDPAAVYPEQFMLYLFRLFTFCCSPSENEKYLQPNIGDLESTLGLTKDEVPASSDGYSDLFSVATEMAKEIGIDIPANSAPINGNQFREALGTLTQDDKTKSAIKGIFSGINLQNPNDLSGAIGKILERMQQTAQEVPDPVQRSMDARADDSQLALPSNQS